MGPVTYAPPLCSLRELQDGTYGINDLADFWDTMAEIAEYKRRAKETAEAKPVTP